MDTTIALAFIFILVLWLLCHLPQPRRIIRNAPRRTDCNHVYHEWKDFSG